MTYEQAKAAAIAAGIPESLVTAEDIRLYGYEVGDPTAGCNPTVAISDKQVKDDLGLLDAEGKANQWTATALAALKRVTGFAASKLVPVLVLALLLAGAGCSSVQARRSTEGAEISVQALNEGHLAFEEGFVQDFQKKETERIDSLFAAAVKSHTAQIATTVKVSKTVQTVDGTGKVLGEKVVVEDQPATAESIEPKIYEALVKQKANLYQQMHANLISMRTKQAIICKNAANAAAYLEGLKAYFDQKAQVFETYNAASGSLMDFLDKFVQAKTAPK